MNASPSLHDLQLWLKWIITDPRGVTEALKNPTPKVEKYRDRYTTPTPSYLGLIVGDSTCSIDRLDIYAEGYFSRILECMRKDFGRTQKVVGEAAFTKLVSEYLKAHPSKFTSIDEVGSRFANFISEFDDIDLNDWVSDLARFEWFWIESFYSRTGTIQSGWQNEMAKNPNVSLQIHPSVRVIHSQWPIVELIKALDSDCAIDSDELNKKSESAIVIYRFHDEVYWEELSPSVFQIIQSLKNGTSLGAALAQVKNIEPEVISKNFSRWVEREILCGVLSERNGRIT
ncbi:MAG: putative DNA-binding domain-containing protein [Bdellovibrionales bacterium]